MISSSGQVPNQGVIPGSVEPTEPKKGVIHKSKSTGITVHKPQVSLAAHSGLTYADRRAHFWLH